MERANITLGFFFLDFSVQTQLAEGTGLQRIWPEADGDFFNSLNQLYPVNAYKEPSFTTLPFVSGVTKWLGGITDEYFWQMCEVFSDAFINCGTSQMSKAVSGAGNSPAVYKLIFDAGRLVHGSTLDYLFGSSSSVPLPAVASQMKSYFGGFIIGLDPNTQFAGGAQRPAWPAWTSASPNALNMTNDGPITQKDPDVSDKCTWLQSQGEKIRN